MQYEAQLLVELGYEVFTPKIIPKDASFRSATVTSEYDQGLTIPAYALEKLNKFDFYEAVWPVDIVTIINRYFGTTYIMPHVVLIKEAVRKFEGQLMLRTFGLDGETTYVDVLEANFGAQIFDEIAALGTRFWFAQGYEQLVECEPPLISERAIHLPVGVPSTFWKSVSSYTGVDKRILFACANCVSIPYYANIYKQFKKDLGDLPHVIVGAQDVPLDDPHVLGFVNDEELIGLYRDSAVLYYHSMEPRHVHYSPIEAAINGMPVIYFEDSLLGRMTPEITMGRCKTFAEARTSIERILRGDDEYTNALREQQRSIGFKFSDKYCKAMWELNLRESGYEVAIAPESEISVYWRELKRTVLRPFAHGMSRLPGKTPPALELAQLATPEVDVRTISDGINFADRRYPSFLRRVVGISLAEPWGRWSDAPSVKIFFSEPLPRSFRLVFLGFAYGPNVGAPVSVKVGNVKQVVTLLGDIESPDTISISLETRTNETVIEFGVPHPTVPPNGDRQIGLGFINLKIEPTLIEIA